MPGSKAGLAVLLVLLGCSANVVFLELLVKISLRPSAHRRSLEMVLLTVALLFVGCMVREATLEAATQEDPGCGNLITFASFLFISVEGFLFTTKCGTVKPKVPFRSWTTLVIMYFLVSVTNNYALNFNISMPLHMIFRAGSLMANMIMGMLLLGKRYSTMKYLSVIMISAGILMCTIMSAKDVTKGATHGDEDEKTRENNETWEFLTWLVGISMLTFALFLSARMGIYQEEIYARFGKHPMEALYYSHCLPLPGFILLGGNIYNHFILALNSTPIVLFGALPIPSTILYLIFNVLTQYLCIASVFTLTSECASLTVTLVVTLRKFISLLFSIWYFDNPFTASHWLGTVMVFSGTLLFSDIPGMIREQTSKKVVKAKES